MDNREETQPITRTRGRPTKDDSDLAWDRKSNPSASYLLDTEKRPIPQRFRAIFVLLQDERTATSKVLTRESLDDLEVTKNLPKQEKDLLYKWWPRWSSDIAEMKAIALLRKEQAEVAGKAQRVADIMERREGFDNLSLPEQMRVTTSVLDKQLQRAALICASTSVEDLEVAEDGKLAVALFKQRIGYIKDLAYVRTMLNDLAQRMEEKTKNEFITKEDDDKMIAVLQAASKVIERRNPK